MFETLEELEEANKAAGQYYFSEDTLEFFGSRNRELINGQYYIEEQANAPEDLGRWQAALFDQNGIREKHEEFFTYEEARQWCEEDRGWYTYGKPGGSDA